MNERLKVGDEVIVYGPIHFERTKVIDRHKGVYTLGNQIKVTRDLIPLNSKMKVERFNQRQWDYLVAQKEVPKLLKAISDKCQGLATDNLLTIQSKLKKLMDKYC